MAKEKKIIAKALPGPGKAHHEHKVVYTDSYKKEEAKEHKSQHKSAKKKAYA